jgi:hypothetical protein
MDESHRRQNSHERVVDSNNKNLAGILQLLGIDVTRDMRVGAGWTF